MTFETIESDFKKKVCDKVRLYPEGRDRFRVFTPFRFGDGDHLSIVLKKSGEQWVLSDEGHTFMHLSYDRDSADLQQGNRRKLIERALAEFGVTDNEGELRAEIEEGRYGDALFSYVQAMLHVTDVTYLNREVVKSTFMEDLRVLIKESVPQATKEFDWSDPESDADGKYPVDCRIECYGRPLFVFGVSNEQKCDLVTIVVLHYEKTRYPFDSMVVFDEQEAIGRKPLARLSDVIGKQFSTLAGNRNRIKDYLGELASNRRNGN